MVKIQIIQEEQERHCLSQDLARVFAHSDHYANVDTQVIPCGIDNSNETLKAHSFLIKARSPVLASHLKEKKHIDKLHEISEKVRLTREWYTANKVNLTFQHIKYTLYFPDIPYELVNEVLRYIYSDKVDNLEGNASKLLPIATRYTLPGLVNLCERALLESLTPANVPNILLLADQCGCEALRKAALNYCEDSTEIKENVQIGKRIRKLKTE